jgi:hypothetical protein
MTSDTAALALAATARNVMDPIRYMVLGTIDEDGCTRTSPVYFVPHRYRDLYWVSTPTSHHSHNLERDDRLSAVIMPSGRPEHAGRSRCRGRGAGDVDRLLVGARTVTCQSTHPARQLRMMEERHVQHV